MPANTWTSEKINLLKEIFETSSKKKIMDTIPGSWTNIRKKARDLGLKRDPKLIYEDRVNRKPRHDSLQPKEIDLLKKIYENNSKKDILKQINRPWHLITKQARKFNLKRNSDLINEDRKKRGPRKDSYNQKEINLLKTIYEDNTKEFILKEFKKAEFNRSWKSIHLTAKSLGLSRNPEIIKQEMINGSSRAHCETQWTEKEDHLLKLIYPNNSKKDICSGFPERTWKAIRERAIKLGLSRSLEIVNNDRQRHLKENLGVNSTWQLNKVKEKSCQTNLDKRGVKYPTQSSEVKERVKRTVQEKYGVDNVFQSEKIKEKIKQTNIERYGFPNPNQNSEIREKSYYTSKLNNSFSTSDEEVNFHEYVSLFDPNVESHVLHPVIRHVMDFYMPRYNLWVQYDGAYWHGKEKRKNDSSARAEKIKINMQNDKIQNENIPNLIRFWSDDVDEAIKKGTILEIIKTKIDEKKVCNFNAHQYIKKQEFLENDLKNLDFDPFQLKASSFEFNFEKINKELVDFILKYEWLGSLGVTPKWSFTARYKGNLAGVIFINEPTSYSKLLGQNTMKYEALIQRGATISWAPKNLGSKLLTFACKWMINNTDKRLFIGYGDPKALEIGTIYQACNFEYLGNNFGTSFLYRHPLIKNNRTFSSQSLNRTSAFKKWCKTNNITPKKDWFKENGFKNLQTIPEGIKNAWKNWKKKILSEAQIFLTERKHKYVLLLGKNKREYKELKNLKTYICKPYPKRNEEYTSECIIDSNIIAKLPQPATIQTGTKFHSTKNRKTPEKLDYIIKNYQNKTQKELAQTLNETKRWVNSQIRQLQKGGSLVTKNPVGSTKSRKNSEKIQFIIDNYNKLTKKEIAKNLNETERWVKKTISDLIGKKLIISKISFPENLIKESDWLPEIKDRLFELRHKYLKTNSQICEILKKEFNFSVNPPALQFWTKKFNCKGKNKQEWMTKYLTKDLIIKLRSEKYRIIDITKYIEKKYGIYISSDLISLHIKKLNLQ